jgi:hypothetical protein
MLKEEYDLSAYHPVLEETLSRNPLIIISEFVNIKEVI